MRIKAWLLGLALSAGACEPPPSGANDPWQARKVPTREGVHPAGLFVVAIEPLDGDSRGTVRDFIARELTRVDPDIEVHRVGVGPLSLNPNVLDSQELAQRLRPGLVKATADVLIGGTVRNVDGEPVTQLRLVAAPRHWEGPSPSRGALSWPSRVDAYELPDEPWARMGMY